MTTTNGTSNRSTKVLPPTKLAHVVLHTHQYNRMLQFYTRFLGANIVFENGHLAFLSYDDEHHRIAIISIPGMKEKDPQRSGLGHISFAYDSLKDLCASYKQRKVLGMEPGWCVNHGPTTSLYYADPDGNSIEIQVDNFETNEEATAFMMASFEQNPLGVDFDVEELCRAVDRGEDEAELKRPKTKIVRNTPEDLMQAAGLMAGDPKPKQYENHASCNRDQTAGYHAAGASVWLDRSSRRGSGGSAIAYSGIARRIASHDRNCDVELLADLAKK